MRLSDQLELNKEIKSVLSAAGYDSSDKSGLVVVKDPVYVVAYQWDMGKNGLVKSGHTYELITTMAEADKFISDRS